MSLQRCCMCLNYENVIQSAISCVYVLGVNVSKRRIQKQIYSFQIKCDHEIDTLEKKKQHSVFILVSGKKVLQSTPGVYFLRKVNEDASKMVFNPNTLFISSTELCSPKIAQILYFKQLFTSAAYELVLHVCVLNYIAKNKMKFCLHVNAHTLGSISRGLFLPTVQTSAEVLQVTAFRHSFGYSSRTN